MPQILESIISALPVAILVIIFGVYMAGLYWREDSKRKLNEYLKNIRDHDISIQKYNGLLGKFTEFENKPPFDTQFDTILKKLSELHSNRDREMKLYTRLRGETDLHSKKGFLNRLLAPYHWLETHQKLNLLEHLDMIVETNVGAVGIDVHQLMHIQNEIARQIATAWQEIQELEHNIQILMQRGVQAGVIAPYKHTYQRLRQQFNNIPAYLLTPSQKPPSNTDTLGHISAAYTILEKSRPILEQPLHNTRLWMKQTELLPQAIEQVSKITDILQDSVLKTPENVDATTFYEAIKEARLSVEHAKEFSTQINPTHLESILEQLTRQYESLNAANEELKAADTILQEYQQYRESLANQWVAVEKLATLLTENPVLPIVLTSTAEEIEFIRAALTRLIDLRNPHTLTRFKEETPLLQEKISKLHELQTDLLTMQTTQAELMALINRLQLPKLKVWIEKTKAAQQRLADYASENYFLPPNWKELNLDAEIEEISKQAHKSLPALGQAIAETDLLEMWTAAQDIDRMVDIIQDGLNNQLQQRKSLIEQEQIILQQHNEIFQLLNQFNNPQLERAKLRLIRQYFRQLEQIKQQLASRNEGTVAGKEKLLAALNTDISAQVEEWHKEDQETLQKQNDAISTLMSEISGKTNLSDELLQSIWLYLAEEEFDQQPESSELAPIVESFLKTQDQLAQTNEYLSSLQPLHAELMQQLNQYQQIKDTFNTTMKETEEFVDFSSSWNQSVVNLERVKKQGEQLAQEMDNFKQNQHPSQSMIRKLNQYTHRYEDQYEKMTDLINQIKEEQNRQKEAEDALQEVMAQWEQVAKTWHEDSIVAENVENLLKRYQNRYRDAKTSYERGKIRFSSFITTVNNLKKHLSFEVIINQNDRSVEISGKEYV